jgi:3-oxoacyl-[acyl-carrier protein] reductase
METIAGKRALVTGAASGIGRAIALALAREHVDLFLLDVNGPALDELAGSLRQQGVRVVARQCDLRNPDELDARLAELLATWCGADIVVNNAGIAYVGPTADMSDEQWDAVLAINLLAPARIIRRLLPSLRQRAPAHVVNICSLAGLIGVRRCSAYSLTKFGLVGFSEALRCELDRYGIGVTAVCPGWVRTAIFRSSMGSRGKTGVREPSSWLSTTPEAVATHVLRAIRKNRPLVVITPLARLLWLMKRYWPSLLWLMSSGFRARVQRRTDTGECVAPQARPCQQA